MSDTPLTDAKIEELEHMPHSFLAAGLAITARELERELAAAKAAHLEAQKALVVANHKIRLFTNARHYNQWQKKFSPLIKAAIKAVNF